MTPGPISISRLTRSARARSSCTFSTDSFSIATNPKIYREVLYWLDPAHDDRQKTQATVQRDDEYDFFEHAQLPNGQWYPARWRQTNRISKDGTLELQNAYDVRLRIYPGARIDPSWFQFPAESPQ